MSPESTELVTGSAVNTAIVRAQNYPRIDPLGLKLREPQEEAIECFYASDKKRKIISLPTGTGKTLAGLTIAGRTNGRVLWIAHRDELISQPCDECETFFPKLTLGIVKGSQNEYARRLTIASIQTLSKRKRLNKILEAGPITLVVYDECFPSWVRVGDQPISEIRIGDIVTSYDETTDSLVSRRVTHVFKRKCSSLVRVRHGSGELVCTPNHPVLTPSGWKPAGSLNTSDSVLERIEHDYSELTVRGVRKNCDPNKHTRQKPLPRSQEIGPSLLFDGMQSNVGITQELRNNDPNEHEVLFRSYDKEQSDETEGGKRETERHSQEDRSQTSSARGKRKAAYSVGNETQQNSRSALEDANDREDGMLARSERIPVVLQNRPGARGTQTRDRNRRTIPLSPRTASTGCQEGEVLAWSRVDGVEVLEQGSDGTFGGLCPGGEVYNLEVEGTHTYLAEGVVVHNCHHAMAKTSKKVLEHLGCFLPGGPTLLGLTATIERSDKLSLIDIFEEIVYRLPISDAIRDGYLVAPVAIQVPLPINPKALRRINDDFAQSDLDRELTRVDAAKATAIAIKVNCGDRKTLVFCASVDQAKKTSEECRNLGMESAWVSGAPHMKTAARKQVIRDLKSGKLRVVICSQLLVEGYDEKTISSVVMAKPTLSQSMYIQQAGRGLRTAKHKTDCLIIDLVFVSNLGLVTADILLANKEKKIQKKRKKRVVEDVNDEWKRLSSYLRTAKIDLMEHGEITYARASDSLYVTAAKDGDLVVIRRVAKHEDNDDRWVIEHQGLIYTPEPIAFQDALATCDLLMPSFGGSAAPNTPEWNAAADKPLHGPGKDASEFTYAAQVPVAAPMLLSAEDAYDLQDRIKHEIEERLKKEFLILVGIAIRDGKGHLYAHDKKEPVDGERWGWRKKLPMGPMIGWISADGVEARLDPLASIEAAINSATRLQARVPDCSVSDIKHLFRTTSGSFKSRNLVWIKALLSDLVPPPHIQAPVEEPVRQETP